MPKVTKVGKFRAKAAIDKAKQLEQHTSLLSSSAAAPTTSQPSSKANEPQDHLLSRGQRRRLAKREQYLKREQMVLSTLRLQRQEQQKNQIDGLDALREALPMATSASKNVLAATPAISDKEQRPVVSNKQKQSIAATEVTHYNLVLQHPSFQSNPFETMQQHLRNTLARDAEEQQHAYDEKVQKEKQTKEKEQQQKKEKVQEYNSRSSNKKKNVRQGKPTSRRSK